MKKQKNEFLQLDFFLGGMTALGYESDASSLLFQKGIRPFLLKGAYGTGKAKWLATLVEKAQLSSVSAVERLHDPHDPSRLVGVVLHKTQPPEPKQWDAILDANAPSAITPRAVGAWEQVASFYEAMDVASLQPQADEIMALLHRIDCLHTRAARYLASMGGLLFDSQRAASCVTDMAKVQQYAQRLSARLIPSCKHPSCEHQQGQGQEHRRFLSAMTPQGVHVYSETVTALADRVVVFHDEYGLASKAICAHLREDALAKGYDVITCPCALFPEEKMEHIIIPSLRLAFVTSNRWHSFSFAQAQNIHCSRFMNGVEMKHCRTRLRFNSKAAQELQIQCVQLLKETNACYEALRKLYATCMDDVVVEQIGTRLLQALQKEENR